VSNGVFVFGMFTKDGPVTWEIHVPVHSLEWWANGQGKTGARRLRNGEVGGPQSSDDAGEGWQPTRPSEGGPCQ
jgi:hypothetical protein